MNKVKERRKEERLRYQLPVWFTEDPRETNIEGVMVDISSSAMAFSCNADRNCPHPGQHLTTRFSLPHSSNIDHRPYMKNFTRTGCVSRVENINDSLCRVAVQFDEPPPFWDTPPVVG